MRRDVHRWLPLSLPDDSAIRGRHHPAFRQRPFGWRFDDSRADWRSLNLRTAEPGGRHPPHPIHAIRLTSDNPSLQSP
jgi:hypothetical protein